jgi:hypothetical protein
MFSAKNYGLPKDLIEAAKRVHEKQLMEYDEDGYIKNPPKGMDKGTEKTREYAAKLGLKGPHLEGEGKLPKKQKLPPLPVRKPKNEEVQFTEEELAEAFAIFLEENFHVDMLTEEDLDYVFENEFPQWLEEGSTEKKQFTSGLNQAFARPPITGIEAQKRAERLGKPTDSQSPYDVYAGTDRYRSGYSSRKQILRDNPPTTRTDQTTGEGRPVTVGGTLKNKPPNPDLDDGAEETNTPISQITRDIERARAEVEKSSTPSTSSAPKPSTPSTSSAPKPSTPSTSSAPKPPSFGAQLRKVGGNAPATSDTAAGRRKLGLLDARARARTAANDAVVRKTGRGQLSWAKDAFEPKGN